VCMFVCVCVCVGFVMCGIVCVCVEGGGVSHKNLDRVE